MNVRLVVGPGKPGAKTLLFPPASRVGVAMMPHPGPTALGQSAALFLRVTDKAFLSAISQPHRHSWSWRPRCQRTILGVTAISSSRPLVFAVQLEPQRSTTY